MTIISHTGGAAASPDPDALQIVSMLDHGEADVLEAGGHLISHCGQSSSCGPMILVQPWLAERDLTGANAPTESDWPVLGRGTAPPFHPPKT